MHSLSHVINNWISLTKNNQQLFSECIQKLYQNILFIILIEQNNLALDIYSSAYIYRIFSNLICT
jgi:hypothetical protein